MNDTENKRPVRMILRELEVRYVSSKKVETPEAWKSRIESSKDIDHIMRDYFEGLMVEHFVIVHLDAKNRVVGHQTIGIGGLSACPVAPSDVFRALLITEAAGWIALHNHPSGDATPSADDVALTDRLVRASSLIGLRMLDHVIIAREGYFSFLDAGLLGDTPLPKRRARRAR